MNRLMRRLEMLFVAITFAEAGEHDTARELLGDQTSSEPEVAVPGDAARRA